MNIPAAVILFGLLGTSIVAMAVNCGLAAQRKIARNVRRIQHTVVELIELKSVIIFVACPLDSALQGTVALTPFLFFLLFCFLIQPSSCCGGG